MTLSSVDFTHLSVYQFIVILMVAALADWAVGTLTAIAKAKFDWALVLGVLESHVLKRVIPIAGLFWLGQSGGILPLVAVADGALALYFVETANSLLGGTASQPSGTG